MVRTVLAEAVAAAQEAGQLKPELDARNVAILLAAAMDGLQLQFLLDPESVDMVEPFSDLIGLLSV
jgi:hypothetical protein